MGTRRGWAAFAVAMLTACGSARAQLGWSVAMLRTTASWDGSQFHIVADGVPMSSFFTMPNVPGAVQPPGGTTDMQNATLLFTGLIAAGKADVNPVWPGITLLSQPLGPGAFEFWCTGPAGEKTLLASGTLAGAAVVGIEGQTTASVQSQTVTYDGGFLLDQIRRYGGYYYGSINWSLLHIDRPGGLGLHASGQLDAFSADMYGSLDVPEPGAMAAIVVASVSLLRRRHSGRIQ